MNFGNNFGPDNGINNRGFLRLNGIMELNIALYNFAVPDVIEAGIAYSAVKKVFNGCFVNKYSFAMVPVVDKCILYYISGLVFIINKLEGEIYQPVVKFFKKSFKTSLSACIFFLVP